MFSYFRRFNRALLLIILSDLFTWGFYGVLNVLTGLYLSQRLTGDVVEIMSLGIFLYFITRAAINIPAGKLLDTLPGNLDEGRMLLFSSLLMGAPFVLYPLISNPLTYYVLQIIFGVGAALHIVSSKKLIVLHVDKNKEGEQLSVYDTLFSVFIAIVGLMGGIVASINMTFFSIVFVCFGLLIISSGIWALMYLRLYYPDRQPFYKYGAQRLREALGELKKRVTNI